MFVDQNYTILILKMTFYYFGYGSNLLTKRIRIQNKSAERVGVGELKDYRLDFADTTLDARYFSRTWKGSPATIIENKESTVYGAVWKMNLQDLHELDVQEGVADEIYKPLDLNIFVQELQENLLCRSYQLVKNPTTILDPKTRPFERQPSQTYLRVIILGAEESNLPKNYIDFLKDFKTNGNFANKSILDLLDFNEN